jgi:hypothetical protein
MAGFVTGILVCLCVYVIRVARMNPTEEDLENY